MDLLSLPLDRRRVPFPSSSILLILFPKTPERCLPAYWYPRATVLSRVSALPQRVRVLARVACGRHGRIRSRASVSVYLLELRCFPKSPVTGHFLRARSLLPASSPSSDGLAASDRRVARPSLNFDSRLGRQCPMTLGCRARRRYRPRHRRGEKESQRLEEIQPPSSSHFCAFIFSCVYVFSDGRRQKTRRRGHGSSISHKIGAAPISANC
ncbi:hypothetical protein C8F01DRAFT_128283 [Mycena amicta]|nr:hypothetical protein C8F01DRAFT_128283 [Mycena amicta]